MFSTCWSPLVSGLLASSSDDKTVRVWNTEQALAEASASLDDPVKGKAAVAREKVLVGHTHNVRGLVWSTEIPFLLLSGSWDGTVRLWDVR